MGNCWQYELGIYRFSDGKYITMTGSYSDDDTRLMGGRQYKHMENDPRTLLISLENATLDQTQNLLSATCSRWSSGGTGPVKRGDDVSFKFDCVSHIGTKTRYFYGRITELTPSTNGVLTLKAESHMKMLDGFEDQTVKVYSGHRDFKVFNVVHDEGVRYAETVTDSDIQEPFEDVGYAAVEVRQEYGDNNRHYYTMSYNGLSRLAQAFTADDNAFLGVTVWAYSDYGDMDGTLTATLYNDNNNSPGDEIAHVDIEHIAAIAVITGKDFSFITSNCPIFIEPGRRYWIVMDWYDYGVNNRPISLFYGDPPASHIIDCLWEWDNTNSEWDIIASHKLNVHIDTVTYESIDYDKYYFDDATDKLYLHGSVTADDPRSSPSYSYYHCRASYYHGTKTHQNITDAIFQDRSLIEVVTSANQARTFGYYSTLGKNRLKALQELMDIHETSGTWSGYQHVMSDYLDGDPYSGTPKIKIGKRLKLTDPATFDFVHSIQAIKSLFSAYYYNGDRLPEAASPAWHREAINPGTVITFDNGALKCLAPNGSASVGWHYHGIGSTKCTMISRVKTDGHGLASRFCRLYIYIDGHYVLVSGDHDDLTYVNAAGTEVSLGTNLSDWKIIRMTYDAGTVKIYLDESITPTVTYTAPVDSGDYVRFIQDGCTDLPGYNKSVWFDYVYWTWAGAWGPDEMPAVNPDDANPIISIDLTLTASRRLSGVTAIGEDSLGHPVCLTKVDSNVSGSIGSQIPGYPKHKFIYNKNLMKLTDLSQAIDASLNHEIQDVYEGSITVPGIWADLMHNTYANDQYGSGEIISLTIPELQLWDENFKVIGVICYDTTTQVFLNNRDIVEENRYKDSVNKGNQNESFISPVGTATDTYYWGYCATVVTTDPAYMILETASGVITQCHRVKCTMIADTDLGINCYVGMFDTFNGYTDSSTKIRYIKLYDAITGGTLKATHDLYAAGPPIRDERFDKWQPQRLFVCLICKAS